MNWLRICMYMCNLFYIVDKQTGLKFQANKRTLFLNGTTLYAPNNNQFVRLSILDLLSEANRLSRFPNPVYTYTIRWPGNLDNVSRWNVKVIADYIEYLCPENFFSPLSQYCLTWSSWCFWSNCMQWFWIMLVGQVSKLYRTKQISFWKNISPRFALFGLYFTLTELFF